MITARKVSKILENVNKEVNEEVIERYSTSGGRYRIEVEKNGDKYNIKYFANGSQDGGSVGLSLAEYKKELEDTISGAARIDGIRYKKV